MWKRHTPESDSAEGRLPHEGPDLDALIDAYVDRELSEDETASLLSRLWHDSDRLERLMTEQALADEIRMSQEWAPLHLTARIRRRLGLRPESLPMPHRSRLAIRLRRASLAAAAAIALSAGIWLQNGEPGSMTPRFAEPAAIQFEPLSDLIHEGDTSVFSPFETVLWAESEDDQQTYPKMTGVLLYSSPSRVLLQRSAERTPSTLDSMPWEIRSNVRLEPPMDPAVELEDLVLPADGEPATGPMSFV